MRFFLILLLTLACPAYAGVSGQLQSSSDYYPYSLGESVDNLIPYLSLDLAAKYKLSRKLRFQSRALLFGNLEAEEPPERFYADLPEAFIEWRLSGLRMRAGMNTLNWGVVDLSSPSDVVNPTTLFHPMRTMKRGAPMVEFDWDEEVLGLHAIYIPVQQRALLPSEDSRWLPRKFLMNIGNSEGRMILPDFIEYEIDGRDVLDDALKNNWGLRLSSRLDNWDFFLMHFEGVAPSPSVRPTMVADCCGPGGELIARSPIALEPLYYRVRTSGVGLVWAREKWIYRAESAYQHTISDDPLLQPWNLSSVVAAETNIDMGTSALTLLSQFYYTENPRSPDNLISSSYRLFDRTLLMGGRWAPREDLLFIASSLYEFNAGGLFWTLSFENKLSDVLRWGMGWRDFSARDDGLIKTFDRNDHAVLDLTYYF